jgi:hypothetical protein
MPQVKRNIPETMRAIDNAQESNETDTLLKTIRMPLGGRDLSKIKGQLPKANYMRRQSSLP